MIFDDFALFPKNRSVRKISSREQKSDKKSSFLIEDHFVDHVDQMERKRAKMKSRRAKVSKEEQKRAVFCSFTVFALFLEIICQFFAIFFDEKSRPNDPKKRQNDPNGRHFEKKCSFCFKKKSKKKEQKKRALLTHRWESEDKTLSEFGHS